MLLTFIAVALGNVVPDFTFELLENNPGTGRVTCRRYRGPWLIVDNGYLKWSTTIPPFKLSTMEKERRWSQWLESLRKDVECTFGILKGRWRILKIGIRLGGVEVADNIFKTCCALHNWLLEIDGLDGEWDGVNGQHEVTDVLRHAPAALQRLYVNPALMDLSGMGHGNDVENGVMPSNGQVLEGVMNDDDPPETVRVVRNLSLNYFRRKLIEHFDILFQRKELVWPSHCASLYN
jgi:hypothetical protein